MNRRVVAAGVAGSALQVVLTAGVTLISYRILLGSVGEARFGVWASVGAVALAGGIAEFGMGAGALRYISLHLGRGETNEAARVAETAVISSAVLVGLAALGLAPLLPSVLRFFWDPSATAFFGDALTLLPWTLALLTANAFQSSCLACLDGAQRVHVRNALAIAGSVVGFGFVLAWVPARGLVGYAQALIAQALGVGAVAWLLLRRALPGLTVVPVRWQWAAFRRIAGYGATWQGISLVNLLADPLAKLLIGRVGGVELAGHYEVATKLALPLRGVVVSAQQALVPAIARMSAEAPDRIGRLYATSLRVSAALVGLALPVLILGAPLAAMAWLDRRDPTFEILYAVLTTAWFLNALSGPAYFDHVGRGRLAPVFAGHATTALAVVTLGPLFGWIGGRMDGSGGGGLGVAVAAALAIVLGSSVAPLALHRSGADGPVGARADDRVLLVMAVALVTAAVITLSGGLSVPVRVAIALLTVVASGAALAAHPDVRRLRRHVSRLASPPSA